jgi:hypothetical protein
MNCKACVRWAIAMFAADICSSSMHVVTRRMVQWAQDRRAVLSDSERKAQDEYLEWVEQ